jgi:hypothetical protein
MWPRNAAAIDPARYRRKGWSEAKCQRAYEQARQQAEAKRSKASNALATWANQVVATSGDPLYLHVGQYSKSPDDFNPPVTDHITVASGGRLEAALRFSAFNQIEPPRPTPEQTPPNPSVQRTRYARR